VIANFNTSSRRCPKQFIGGLGFVQCETLDIAASTAADQGGSASSRFPRLGAGGDE
jgi:hypothetical protein